jgi:hypothetical protein
MKTENQNISTKTVKALTISGIALWFIFALVMSLGGRYQAGAGHPPLPLGLTFLVPIIVFVAAYWSSISLRQFTHGLDLKLITVTNIFRFVGFDFLYHYAQGKLPAGFALPAGIGDVITAAAAIPLVMAMSRKAPSARKWFVAWNIFGLADLFVAVGSGVLHSVSSLGMLQDNGPSTAMMSDFPRALIPTFFVPLWILLHFLALARRNELATPHEPLHAAEIQTSLSPYHP